MRGQIDYSNYLRHLFFQSLNWDTAHVRRHRAYLSRMYTYAHIVQAPQWFKCTHPSGSNTNAPVVQIHMPQWFKYICPSHSNIHAILVQTLTQPQQLKYTPALFVQIHTRPIGSNTHPPYWFKYTPALFVQIHNRSICSNTQPPPWLKYTRPLGSNTHAPLA